MDSFDKLFKLMENFFFFNFKIIIRTSISENISGIGYLLIRGGGGIYGVNRAF